MFFGRNFSPKKKRGKKSAFGEIIKMPSEASRLEARGNNIFSKILGKIAMAQRKKIRLRLRILSKQSSITKNRIRQRQKDQKKIILEKVHLSLSRCKYNMTEPPSPPKNAFFPSSQNDIDIERSFVAALCWSISSSFVVVSRRDFFSSQELHKTNPSC